MTENKIKLENYAAILAYDPETNSFELLPKNVGGACLRGARFSLDMRTPSGRKMTLSLPARAAVEETIIQDVQGDGRQIQISGLEPAAGLQITCLVRQYPQRPFFLLRIRVENKSSSTFILDAFNLVEAKPVYGGEVLPGNERRPLDFFKVGWHDWVYTGLRQGSERDVNSLFLLKNFVGSMYYDPALPVGKRSGEFWSENWGILSDQRNALLAGLVSMADQFGQVHARCNPGKASLTLSSLADGVPLEPGENRESEWGYLEWMALPVQDPSGAPRDPMAEYAEAVARQMKPRRRAAPPPAMWTHWYYYFEHVTQEQILENLEAADRLRAKIPYEIFQLDGGYYKHWGDYLDWNERFTIGPRELARRIAEKGFTPGIWLAPFVVEPGSTIDTQHPDWLVRDASGKPVRSGYFYSFHGYALDLSNPAVLDHIRTLMDTLVHEMGFHFIKTDFVYAGALPGVRMNPRLTRAQAFRKGMEAVREGIGEETYLLGCGCPMGPAIGIVDAMRIGPDTCPRWEPFLWSTPWAAPLIRQDRSVPALRNNIRHTINLSALHRRWWWSDPDCLMVRSDNTQLTREEVKSNVSLIGSNGNLIIHSDALNQLSPEQIEMVSRMTPHLDSDGRALDLLEKEMPELYAVNHERATGRWVSAAVFNWGDTPADKTLDLERLGFRAGMSLHGFDFWEEKYFQAKTGMLELKQIPAHGCKLLRFCLTGGEARLVGDTLHTSQGGEIAEWSLSENKVRLATMDLKREARGGLWLWLPGKPLGIKVNGADAPFVLEEQNIVRLPLDFEGQATIEIAW